MGNAYGQLLVDKVAIVTGAGSGIGRASAIELARQGASVLVVDINEASAEAVASAINDGGGQAAPFNADVADEQAVAAMVRSAVDRFGALDILHNNAAATRESLADVELVDLDSAVWDRTMAVNARGAFLGCKYAIPRMLERGAGVIINTSSGAGSVGEPVRTAYGASKAAIEALTRSVAVQYGKRGIRCVAVAPGITLAADRQQALEGTEWLAMMRRHHLTPELGYPEDTANLVAFLASDLARFVTGGVFTVDGGITAAVAFAAELRGRGTSIF